MVDTQQIRDEFVARLNEALDDVPGVRPARGRNVDVQKLMAKKGWEGSTQASHKWFNGESMPEKDSMRMLAEVCGVRAEWLEYGEGPKRAADRDDNQGKESNVIAADFSKKDLQSGELSIPQYDVRGAMGSGQLPNDYVEIIRHVTMHKSHLDLLGISYTSPANLAIITGWGQSMAGTINHGEPVFVDRGITSFTGDGVYVFTWDNLVYIKRLQKESKTHFKVISDNREHDPFNVEIADVAFHARAVLAWNARKL